MSGDFMLIRYVCLILLGFVADRRGEVSDD